jgi:hypothetical protein
MPVSNQAAGKGRMEKLPSTAGRYSCCGAGENSVVSEGEGVLEAGSSLPVGEAGGEGSLEGPVEAPGEAIAGAGLHWVSSSALAATGRALRKSLRLRGLKPGESEVDFMVDPSFCDLPGHNESCRQAGH